MQGQGSSWVLHALQILTASDDDHDADDENADDAACLEYQKLLPTCSCHLRTG